MTRRSVRKKYRVNYKKLSVFLMVVILGLSGVGYFVFKPEPVKPTVTAKPTFLHIVRIRPGEQAKVVMENIPVSLMLKGVVLNTSDASIATLDSKGFVFAKGEGDADIYLTDKNIQILVSHIVVREQKTIYLTFDDGPSTSITPLLLEVLDKYKVKATFFVVGQYVTYYPDLLKEIQSHGHSIGIHSDTHNYSEIYKNSQTLLGDVNSLEDRVFRTTGKRPNLYRFPGGSFEARQLLDSMDYRTFTDEMHSKGYRIFDWSCSLGDTSPKLKTPEALFKSALKRFSDDNYVVFLAHDIGNKNDTPKAIDLLIKHFMDDGYVFDVLDNYSGELVYE